MGIAKRFSKAEKCFQKAVVAIDKQNLSRRRAAFIARLPLSTFQYRLLHKDNPPRSHAYLTNDEEQVIVDLIKQYSDRGFPLNREDIKDAVQMVVNSLPKERQDKLPFVNNRPGKKFLRNLNRHQGDISFRRSTKEQEVRWRACNADTLTTFLSIAKIIDDYRLDSYHIANLDEMDMSPNKDCLHSDRRKSYVTRSSFALQRSPEFRNIDRITMMPVVFASGCLRRPLFVVKGKSLKFRVTGNTEQESIETIADCLPAGSVITTRESIAGVDSNSFMQSKMFVTDNVDRKRNGQKMLLLMDGYRSHMTFPVLDMFDKAGIITYALPAHTSGLTQPLDVGVFGPFKMHFRNLVEGLSSPQSSLYDALTT